MKVKKSKKSYDNKVITWISIGLAAFIAVVVAIVLIITLTTGYVAKVDGLKIYDYEYIYFLQSAMYTEYSENFEEPEGFDDRSPLRKTNIKQRNSAIFSRQYPAEKLKFYRKRRRLKDILPAHRNTLRRRRLEIHSPRMRL